MTWPEGDHMVKETLAYVAELFDQLPQPRPATPPLAWAALEDDVARAYEAQDVDALRATLGAYVRFAYTQWFVDGTIMDVSHPDAAAAGNCPHCGGTYSLDVGPSPTTGRSMRQCALSQCGWNFHAEEAPIA